MGNPACLPWQTGFVNGKQPLAQNMWAASEISNIIRKASLKKLSRRCSLRSKHNLQQEVKGVLNVCSAACNLKLLSCVPFWKAAYQED